jgi:hypothetical protein
MLEFMNALRSLPDDQARRFVASELTVDGKSWTDLLALKRQEPAFGPIVETIAEAASRGRQAHEQATWEAHIAQMQAQQDASRALAEQVKTELARRAGKKGNFDRARLQWREEIRSEIARLQQVLQYL